MSKVDPAGETDVLVQNATATPYFDPHSIKSSVTDEPPERISLSMQQNRTKHFYKGENQMGVTGMFNMDSSEAVSQLNQQLQ
jgi:hypothetical protein